MIFDNMKLLVAGVVFIAALSFARTVVGQTIKPKPPDQGLDMTKNGAPLKSASTTFLTMPTATPTPSPSPKPRSALPQSGTSKAPAAIVSPGLASTGSSPKPNPGALTTNQSPSQKAAGDMRPAMPNPTPKPYAGEDHPVITQGNGKSVTSGKSPTVSTAVSKNNLGKANVVDGSKMTKEAFLGMPNNAVILLPEGRQVTKQQMLDESKARFVQREASLSKTAQPLDDERAKFAQKQRSDLKARNDKVLAEIARYNSKAQAFLQSAQYLSIHNEATALNAQYAQASPAEKRRIEQRAQKLQRQLENLKAANLK